MTATRPPALPGNNRRQKVPPETWYQLGHVHMQVRNSHHPHWDDRRSYPCKASRGMLHRTLLLAPNGPRFPRPAARVFGPAWSEFLLKERERPDGVSPGIFNPLSGRSFRVTLDKSLVSPNCPDYCVMASNEQAIVAVWPI